MEASSIRDFRELGVRVLRIDPLMLLATLGLVAASIYVVGTATRDDIPGDHQEPGGGRRPDDVFEHRLHGRLR